MKLMLVLAVPKQFPLHIKGRLVDRHISMCFLFGTRKDTFSFPKPVGPGVALWSGPSPFLLLFFRHFGAFVLFNPRSDEAEQVVTVCGVDPGGLGAKAVIERLHTNAVRLYFLILPYL